MFPDKTVYHLKGRDQDRQSLTVTAVLRNESWWLQGQGRTILVPHLKPTIAQLVAEAALLFRIADVEIAP